MQGSTPRTRKTLPLSAARNFDGTVSRFFASSVCSKVPWKAKAHVVRQGSQSIRGGGVGGAPPPRTGFATTSYPTFPHSATHFSFGGPRDGGSSVAGQLKLSLCRDFRVGGRWRGLLLGDARPLAAGGSARRLASGPP